MTFAGPNDIEFSGERKRVRCNEGVRRPTPGPSESLDAFEGAYPHTRHGSYKGRDIVRATILEGRIAGEPSAERWSDMRRSGVLHQAESCRQTG